MVESINANGEIEVTKRNDDIDDIAGVQGVMSMISMMILWTAHEVVKCRVQEESDGNDSGH